MSTKSMKLKNLTKIKNEIVQILDESQEIKRYCIYSTNTPLLEMGKQLDGKMVIQDNINDSIIDKNIIPYRFMEDVLQENKTLIFVYFNEANLTDVLGSYRFNVDIFVHKSYDVLEELGQERNVEIATTIADLLDEKSIIGFGQVELNYGRQVRMNTKTEYTIFELDLEVKMSNFRVRR